MRILFLNPPFLKGYSRTSRSPGVSSSGTLYYPIWLAYAAGVVEREGHEVLIMDAVADRLPVEKVINKIINFNPKLLIVDTSTPSIYNDVQLADRLKANLPDTFVILVGTHPSALPEETLMLASGIDACAIGEYDYTIRDLAAALASSSGIENVSGLVIRKGEKFLRTQDREKISNLDDLPFVSEVYKKYLNPKNYFFAASKNPMLMIITGRGCPFHCFYCVYPQTFHSHQYRQRSPENVVEEFEYIKNNFPQVREVAIEDDCFTANPARVRKICDLLIQRNNTLSWYCNARGDVDYQTLTLMKAAGCRLIIVGYESSSQRILNNMNKGEKVDGYIRFTRDAKRAGLLIHGCMMCGGPDDTPDIQEKNFLFSKKLDCDSMQFYPLYPYPGTKAYSWAKEKGFLTSKRFSDWITPDGEHSCVISNQSMSSSQMINICASNMRRYHFRPRYIAKKLFQALHDPEEGKRSLFAGLTFIKKQLIRR